MKRALIVLGFGVACLLPGAPGKGGKTDIADLLAGRFRWTAGAPLVEAADSTADQYYSVKDPSIVYYRGRWHLFCTVRGKVRSHQIEYLSFRDWRDAEKGRRRMLTITDGYFCAPKVFYFAPHKKWYLIYQTLEKSRQPALQPAWSTTADIADPGSWTSPTLLFEAQPEGIKAWIDFWIICDGSKAHLFFTSNDGRMWRAETALADFPHGWGRPEVVLQGDIYEASHTYRLKGLDKYLTVVEAEVAGGRRYYKAYIAGRLDGEWTPLAAAGEQAFAAPSNVRFTAEHWTDSFSHGELIRDGYDQTLTVDPSRLRFLFQGISDEARIGKVYGQIPWRLGILKYSGSPTR